MAPVGLAFGNALAGRVAGLADAKVCGWLTGR
jgi:hypothetical protein